MDVKVRLGIAPTLWSNDELPELGADIPLETSLAEMREAGFSGTETGGKLPTTTQEMKELLAAFELQLVAGQHSGRVLATDFSEEKDRAAQLLELLGENGASAILYRETTGTVHNRRDLPLARRPRLDAEQMRLYGRKLTRFAEHCHEEGVPLSFHPHMGTAIETEDDVDGLMNWTGEAVGLLLDTGHMTFAGGDPIGMGRRHRGRINHVHAGDVRRSVLGRIDPKTWSFPDAVMAGVFTVPGDGGIEWKRVAEMLAEIKYQGWIVVAAEQDPKRANPLKVARIGFEALGEALDGAGYQVEG